LPQDHWGPQFPYANYPHTTLYYQAKLLVKGLVTTTPSPPSSPPSSLCPRFGARNTGVELEVEAIKATLRREAKGGNAGGESRCLASMSPYSPDYSPVLYSPCFITTGCGNIGHLARCL
jgi:hypothetical protein